MDTIPHDAVAFEAFYRRYHALVSAVAKRLVFNHADREDVVQRVFEKAWAAPNAYRGGSVESWLITVTKHICIDELRTMRRRRGKTPSRDDRVAAVNESAEDEAMAAAARDELNHALRRLDGRRRELIVAAFIGDQSHRAIADAAHLPLGTVKTRIRTGFAKLRAMLRESV